MHMFYALQMLACTCTRTRRRLACMHMVCTWCTCSVAVLWREWSLSSLAKEMYTSCTNHMIFLSHTADSHMVCTNSVQIFFWQLLAQLQMQTRLQAQKKKKKKRQPLVYVHANQLQDTCTCYMYMYTAEHTCIQLNEQYRSAELHMEPILHIVASPRSPVYSLIHRLELFQFFSV